MKPSVNVVQELNDRGTIGRVEPFGGNNTRYITVRPRELKEFAETVFQEYGPTQEWITLAVTPRFPVAVYPTEEDPAECETGIALAPGLKPDVYDELSKEDTE